jgi:CheY-like chemotaxis protein
MIRPVHVLICDDEPDIRELYRNAFEFCGAIVEEAVDGDEGIAMASKSHPDLVILDLFMPRRDGLSALPEIRAQSPESTVLVVSAYAAAVEVFDRARAHGAAACFDKLGFLPRIPALLERYGEGRRAVG